MIGVRTLCRRCAQGIETIAMPYCAILAIPRIVIVTIIIIIALLFPIQERQQSDLEHFANVF